MTEQYVYFAEACGKIKIGCSTKPHERIWQVGEWVPYPITLLATMSGSYALERALHHMFHADWSHGEWFNASDQLREFAMRVASGLPVAIDIPTATTEFRTMLREKKLMARRFRSLPVNLQPEMYADFHDKRWKGKNFPPEMRQKFIDTLRAHDLWVEAA